MLKFFVNFFKFFVLIIEYLILCILMLIDIKIFFEVDLTNKCVIKDIYAVGYNLMFRIIELPSLSVIIICVPFVLVYLRLCSKVFKKFIFYILPCVINLLLFFMLLTAC